jgi:hypothetical protein
VPKEKTIPNFSQVYVHNKYHKFYFAKNEDLGPCSMIVLNGITDKKVIFGNLCSKLERYNQIEGKAVLKLKGIVIMETNCWLLFEPILSSYKNKIKEKVPMDNTFKFITLFFLIELVFLAHQNQIGLLEIRPSNLLYSNIDELKYLIPFRKY